MKGKSTWTLDEIRALPVTEKLVTQNCAGNINNGPLISTWVARGVTMADFIEACGGLEDGMNTMFATTYDGWKMFGAGFDVAMLAESDAMLTWEYNGEELNPVQGAPLALLIPGLGGAFDGKYITGLSFDDSGTGIVDAWASGSQHSANVTSGWMWIEDGEELKVGEPVTLQGYVYEERSAGHKVGQVAFSADYGHTWNAIDVPADHDPNAWITFEGQWTPQKPGTYVLKVRCVDNIDADVMTNNCANYPDPCANVIVRVTE